jgi:hypothetical protein
MKKMLFSAILHWFLFGESAIGQVLDCRHDPKLDINLSPNSNSLINPEKNSTINPLYNWNINPEHNNQVNPDLNSSINPLNHYEFNPEMNKDLNPMFHNEFHPKSPLWRGLYIFDKDDELIGYVSVATQQLMLSFDRLSGWNGFFVRAANGVFNFFDSKGEWTGQFLCFDSVIGYNLFDKGGAWTGHYIK